MYAACHISLACSTASFFGCLAFCMRITKSPKRIRINVRLPLLLQFISCPRTLLIDCRRTKWICIVCAHRVFHNNIITFSLHALHGRHFSIQYFGRHRSTHKIKWTSTHVFLFVLGTHTDTQAKYQLLPFFTLWDYSWVDGDEEAGSESSGRYSSTFHLNNIYRSIYGEPRAFALYTVMRSSNTTECSTVSDACRVFLGSCLVDVVYAKHCSTSSSK